MGCVWNVHALCISHTRINPCYHDTFRRSARIPTAASPRATRPDCFDLVIPQKQATRRARIEWRRDDEVGVSFEGSSALRPDGEKGEEALRRRIRALEAEIERLQNRIAQLTSG